VRPENPFLPAGVDGPEAATVSQVPLHYLCQRDPHTRELAILHGLYLGGVAVADRKLGEVLDMLRAAPTHDPLVTVVTSDHGEHFGEHRLVLHNFGIYEQLIHVPLVVHGLTGVPPGVVHDAVQLADIGPSMLEWSGVPLPAGLAGRPLPLRDASAGAPRPVFAEYTEIEGREKIELPEAVKHLAITRDACTPEDRLFGDMEAVIDYPRKLVRYADGSTALYDLAVDPGELHDLTTAQPAVVARLTDELAASAAQFPPRAEGERWAPDPALAERLRALGYLGGGR
jgi:arylsulfatase A-like enzyme